MDETTLKRMRSYLEKSISSKNRNKIHGVLAEVDFRIHLSSMGYGDRVSVGGWILRNNYTKNFGEHTVAVFPHIIDEHTTFEEPTSATQVPLGLHTICATFHQLGIKSYFAMPVVRVVDGERIMVWMFLQLGLPFTTNFCEIHDVLVGFEKRPANKWCDFLQNSSDVSALPDESVPEEYSKERLRVFMHEQYLFEISDIDGLLWGERFTYPLEIKEKTPAKDDRLGGEYFGLDIGPFTKLAFFSARTGNLRSLYIVREIDSKTTRNCVNWHFIRYEKLAQYASWQLQRGGKNMIGGESTVIMIPKKAFAILDRSEMAKL